MIGILIRTTIIGLGIWLAAYIVPGVTAGSGSSLVWAAIALGLINALVRPVLVLLTLPATILTLGLFLLVLNAAMLNLAGWFVDGFEVEGFWSSVFGAIIISLVSGACSRFIGSRGRYDVLVVRR
jgi:putative membrane protein